MVGFDTIGNATLIAYDDQPVLVTDPWTSGGAYFGAARSRTPFPWSSLTASEGAPAFGSHGHPDHLSLESLHDLPNKQFRLANHIGGGDSDMINLFDEEGRRRPLSAGGQHLGQRVRDHTGGVSRGF